MAGIYLHIPFCKQACHYCDFHFSTNQKLREPMIRAMTNEIIVNKNYLQNEVLNSIYFGGGTPSLLNADELTLLMESVTSHFKVSADVEITVEANPDDLSIERIGVLKKAGVNRMSIGVQSFNNHILQKLNRAHDSVMAKDSIRNALEAGVENLTVDLMYGLPGLTVKAWENDLAQFFEFKLPHLSAYCLTIEPKTVFGHQARIGKLPQPDEKVVVEQFRMLINRTKLEGYEHYEISNFCQPGRQSKHNSAYWKGEKYLGIGPSAHSYNGNIRRWNISNNSAYIKAIQSSEQYYEQETLTSNMRFNEYVMTSLRTIWGCDPNFIERHFGEAYKNYLAENALPYFATGHIETRGNTYFLTEKGKLVADKITSDLFYI